LLYPVLEILGLKSMRQHSRKGGDRRMKKLLTVTLMFVFALALVLALGCSKKQETSTTETGSGMEQTTPPMDTTGMADTTGTTH